MAMMEDFRAKMEDFNRRHEEYMERSARQHNEIMTCLREIAVSRGCDVSDWPSSAGVEGVEGTQSDNGCETKVVVKTSVVIEQDSTQQTDGDQKINTVEDIGTKSTQSGHEEGSKEPEEETTMVQKNKAVKDMDDTRQGTDSEEIKSVSDSIVDKHDPYRRINKEDQVQQGGEMIVDGCKSQHGTNRIIKTRILYSFNKQLGGRDRGDGRDNSITLNLPSVISQYGLVAVGHVFGCSRMVWDPGIA